MKLRKKNNKRDQNGSFEKNIHIKINILKVEESKHVKVKST